MKVPFNNQTSMPFTARNMRDPLLITHGVPQGAILFPTPLLYLFERSTSRPKDCRLESFVDDSKVLLPFPLEEIETASRKIEKDLHRVATRCCQNNLLINPEKTKFCWLEPGNLLTKCRLFRPYPSWEKL